ncbi:hypothetical protein BSKO_10440 [Bryopsis sp. KO-2023]|nr:hypothetical protein BSKO_10440 [Bryopsis sp. KO-2023]
MEVLHLNNLEDGILIKIFSMVVGPSRVEFNPFFGGFFRGLAELEPTVASGFHNILMLPQVCWRWRKLVDTSPSLWKVVFVGQPEDDLLDPPSIHPVVSIPWWAKHSTGIESAHIRGDKTKLDGALDTYNLGVVSLLSRKKLRVLHLDDCFTCGATRTLLPMLMCLKNLEQLQVGPAKDEFISGANCLTALTKLRVLELQGMENACIAMSSEFLPISLEVLGLGALDVDAHGGDRYLTNLKVLQLVEVDWKGPFCGHLEHLPNLKELILSDVFHLEEEFVETEFLPHDLVKLSGLANLTHLEVQGDLGRDLEKREQGFFERLGEELVGCPPFLSLERLCLSLWSLKEMSPDFAQYENLTHLQLEGFIFGEVPEAILELPLLCDLGMTWCDLKSFPDVVPKCAETIRHLRLSDNNFDDIPTGLRHWTGIKTLDLSQEGLALGEGILFLLDMPNIESVRLSKGKTRVALSSLNNEGFPEEVKELCHDVATAFRFGFLCGELQSRVPQCRVYI